MLRLLPLLALPFLAWLMPPAAEGPVKGFLPEKVNLALRRTADGLLRAAGDSTSRIPAIEQSSESTWRVRIERHFDYAQLPALLQASLDLYGIKQPYQVAVRRCSDATIDLGYHQIDFLENRAVPCGGREIPEGCRYIEISFLGMDGKAPFWTSKMVLLLFVLSGMNAFWVFRRKKSGPVPDIPEMDWLAFGNSRLEHGGTLLICNGVRHTLTFREAKLLRLFATHPDRLLERDYILQQVWADEGIMVGRSVDVFVSRLRKKLTADPSVGIVAVHGVGYRLETGKGG